MKKINKFVFLCFIAFFSIGALVYAKDVVYRGQQYRDPYKSLIPTTVSNEIRKSIDLKVQGIIWNTDKPNAIIDGNVVGIGDIVKGAEVLNVTKKGILVLFEGQTFIINMSN